MVSRDPFPHPLKIRKKMKKETKKTTCFVLNMFLFFMMDKFYTKMGDFARGRDKRDKR